jgi:hypothetical protein
VSFRRLLPGREQLREALLAVNTFVLSKEKAGEAKFVLIRLKP